MNPDIKQKWVNALRSGEYKQGRQALISYTDNPGRGRAGHGERVYCCLGVLCDIALKEGVVDSDGLNFWTKDNVMDTSDITLPWGVAEWAGLSDEDPIVPSTNRTLAELNDEEYATFNQIANYIEDEL